MFDLDGSAGVFDSWVGRWRTFRGIDKWHLVDAEVVYCEQCSNGESDYYKLTLKYQMPTQQTGYQPLTFVTLTSNSPAIVGDTIQLRAHPEKPKAVFANTQESAAGLMAFTLFAAVAILLLTIHGCNSFFADPS